MTLQEAKSLRHSTQGALWRLSREFRHVRQTRRVIISTPLMLHTHNLVTMDGRQAAKDCILGEAVQTFLKPSRLASVNMYDRNLSPKAWLMLST